MIGRKAEAVLNRAVRYAVEQEHEYFTLEHVLWSLLADSQVRETIEVCGGNPTEIRQELEVYLQTEIPKASRADSDSLGSSKSSDSPDSAESSGAGESDGDEDSQVEHPVATLSIQRLIQRALFHVQSAGKDEIQPEDLLVALFQGKDSKALLLLVQQGIERLDVLNYVSHGIRKDREERLDDSQESDDHSESSSEEGSEGSSEVDRPVSKAGRNRVFEDPLSLYASNLNENAKAGKSIHSSVGKMNSIE